jgi:hypothetical protein
VGLEALIIYIVLWLRTFKACHRKKFNILLLKSHYSSVWLYKKKHMTPLPGAGSLMTEESAIGRLIVARLGTCGIAE